MLYFTKKNLLTISNLFKQLFCVLIYFFPTGLKKFEALKVLFIRLNVYITLSTWLYKFFFIR